MSIVALIISVIALFLGIFNRLSLSNSLKIEESDEKDVESILVHKGRIIYKKLKK